MSDTVRDVATAAMFEMSMEPDISQIMIVVHKSHYKKCPETRAEKSQRPTLTLGWCVVCGGGHKLQQTAGERCLGEGPYADFLRGQVGVPTVCLQCCRLAFVA